MVDAPARESGAPACALRGQQCYGRVCCEGAGTCDSVPTAGGSTYACGGVVAGGTDVTCQPPGGDPRCRWIEVAECGTGRPIAEFCPAGESVGQLRRCDTSCFVPDQYYQAYGLCSCEGGPGPGMPATCNCDGTSWAAVLCCTP